MGPIDKMVIDCCVYLRWKHQQDLLPFLEPGWREFVLGRPDPRVEGYRMVDPLPIRFHPNPEGERLAHRMGIDDGGPIFGRSIREQLDRSGVSRAVVVPEAGLSIAAIPNHFLGVAVAKAINDWTLAQLEELSDNRLYSVIVAPNQLPDEAAAEIRRVGTNPRIVGILMGGNGLSKPFGHPLYHPIYRAASELDLPIMVHVGGDLPPTTLSHPVGGGLPATHVEYYILRSHSAMAHLTSLIGQGVFEQWPSLKVLIVGANGNWLPSFLWRFDGEFKAFGPNHAPWLTRRPSQYLRDNVRVSTYSLGQEGFTPGMVRALGTVAGIESILCFASGYPNWDSTQPDVVRATLPDAWHTQVMAENAFQIFRWNRSEHA